MTITVWPYFTEKNAPFTKFTLTQTCIFFVLLVAPYPIWYPKFPCSRVMQKLFDVERNNTKCKLYVSRPSLRCADIVSISFLQCRVHAFHQRSDMIYLIKNFFELLCEPYHPLPCGRPFSSCSSILLEMKERLSILLCNYIAILPRQITGISNNSKYLFDIPQKKIQLR